ncbi:MAG: deoxyribodipyrimidine photo-lyase, partial [Aquificaceae bacterium]|nr:deoxyribodipyrimidine photo-lyase [Aquificaceae bacterium]
MRALYLFKRDLRLEDNRALAYASERHREILPLFVFDPEIIESLRAEGERLYYVVRAVERLSKRIKLYCAYGKTHEVLRDILKSYKPSHLYTTASYSWDGADRNKSIKKVCEEFGVEYIEVFENFLVDPREVPQRKVYTPFYK